MRLKDKVAIVTGAGRGLGQMFSIALAKEGAKIVATDVINLENTVKEIEALGSMAKGLQADVTNEAETVKLAEDTVKAFGRIDILVNCAAIYYGLRRKPFYEIDPKEWDKVMTVNVKGTWLCVRAVFPYMKQQGKGKIVNLSSETFFTGSHGFVHYVTSKGGVIGLTRALAVELGPYHININALAPGFTDTEASRTIADVTKYDVSRTPLTRLEQPHDLIGAAIFFASDESDFITGQTLLVDGGRAMH
ncbi:MAG: 3-oxoacyl-ACP reductase family protein [Thermodesulfobacteriota bacterium]|jgi:NAD(P)-dependent dehydrogenase (short-subunit alcohol dehydrogenase family)